MNCESAMYPSAQAHQSHSSVSDAERSFATYVRQCKRHGFVDDTDSVYMDLFTSKNAWRYTVTSTWVIKRAPFR